MFLRRETSNAKEKCAVDRFPRHPARMSRVREEHAFVCAPRGSIFRVGRVLAEDLSRRLSGRMVGRPLIEMRAHRSEYERASERTKRSTIVTRERACVRACIGRAKRICVCSDCFPAHPASAHIVIFNFEPRRAGMSLSVRSGFRRSAQFIIQTKFITVNRSGQQPFISVNFPFIPISTLAECAVVRMRGSREKKKEQKAAGWISWALHRIGQSEINVTSRLLTSNELNCISFLSSFFKPFDPLSLIVPATFSVYYIIRVAIFWYQ